MISGAGLPSGTVMRRTKVRAGAQGPKVKYSLSLVTAAFWLCGCGPEPVVGSVVSPPKPDKSESGGAGRQEPRVHVFSAPASVLAGAPLEHTFTIASSHRTALSLRAADVTKSCGCTTLDVPETAWLPASPASIRMTVDTTGRLGLVRESAVLEWKDSAGASHPIRLILEGQVVAPLEVDPPAVAFDPDECLQGLSKHVTIRSSYAIDWSTFQITAAPPPFTVKATPRSDGGGITCAISVAEAPPGVPYLERDIRYRVQLPPDADGGPGDHWLGYLRCIAYMDVPLTIKPPSVRIRHGQARSASVRFLLEGTMVPSLAERGFYVTEQSRDLPFTFSRPSEQKLFVSAELPMESGMPRTSELVVTTASPRASVARLTISREGTPAHP